jgi:hypothetical protein
MNIIAGVPVLNIWLLSWFAVGYAHCYTWMYFNFEKTFQILNVMGNCYFTVCLEWLRCGLTLRQEFVACTAENGNRVAERNLQ